MLIFKYKKVFLLFAALVLIAFALNVSSKPTDYLHSTYFISTNTAQILFASLAITYLLILYFCVRAYVSVRYYSDSIIGSEEWGAFRDLRRSLFVFALAVAVLQVLSSATMLARHHHLSSVPHFVQATDYFNVVLGAGTAYYLYKSSVALLQRTSKTGNHPRMAATCAYIIFSAIYVYLFFHHPVPVNPQAPSLLTIIFPNSLFQSGWVASLTLTATRLAVWYAVFMAILNLRVFQNNVKGKFYRSSFRTIPTGWLLILLSLILIRVIQAILLVQNYFHPTYIVMICIVVGSGALTLAGAILISYGTHKLHRLEQL